MSTSNSALVSIGLPVRNGEATIESVVASILAQDYRPLEIVISDNASTDRTEEICLRLASVDSTISYHRQHTNIGLLNNFDFVLHSANGKFFRWIGDDDSLHSDYISRCVECLESDERLLLATTDLEYVEESGDTYTLRCRDTTMLSDDRIERFGKLASWLATGSMPLDPLYGLFRRDALLPIIRRNMIREDEVFAARLSLAGRWGHVAEVLGTRNMRSHNYPLIARRLGVPAWQAHIPTAVECWEILRYLSSHNLSADQQRRARIAVGRLFIGRQWQTFLRRSRNLATLLTRGLRGTREESKV